MRINRKIAQVAVVGALIIPTLPATAASGGQATEATGKSDRLVCKRIDITGARTRSKRVCLTSEQWKKVERDSS